MIGDDQLAVLVRALTFQLIDTAGDVVAALETAVDVPAFPAAPDFAGLLMYHLDPSTTDSALRWTHFNPLSARVGTARVGTALVGTSGEYVSLIGPSPIAAPATRPRLDLSDIRGVILARLSAGGQSLDLGDPTLGVHIVGPVTVDTATPITVRSDVGAARGGLQGLAFYTSTGGAFTPIGSPSVIGNIDLPAAPVAGAMLAITFTVAVTGAGNTKSNLTACALIAAPIGAPISVQLLTATAIFGLTCFVNVNGAFSLSGDWYGGVLGGVAITASRLDVTYYR